MSACEVCGDGYGRTFEIILDGRHHVFDSFDCALHALSRRCARCGRRILGDGSDVGGGACAACADAGGVDAAGDRAG